MATPNLKSISSVTPGILYSGQLTSAETTIYTVPASSAVKLAKLSLNNTGSGTIFVTVSVVPSGSTADATHRVISIYPLAAGDTLIVTEIEGVWLGTGDFVSVKSNTGTVLDAMLSGLVFA